MKVGKMDILPEYNRRLSWKLLKVNLTLVDGNGPDLETGERKTLPNSTGPIVSLKFSAERPMERLASEPTSAA